MGDQGCLKWMLRQNGLRVFLVRTICQPPRDTIWRSCIGWELYVVFKCPEYHLRLYALWEFSLHQLWIPLSPLGCVEQDGKKWLIAEKWTRKWSGWFPLKKGFVVVGWRAEVELDDVAGGLVLCRWKYIRGSESDSFPILLLLSFCVELQLLARTLSLLSARHAGFPCLFLCSLKID